MSKIIMIKREAKQRFIWVQALLLIMCMYLTLLIPSYCFSSARSFLLQYRNITESPYAESLSFESRLLSPSQLNRVEGCMQDPRMLKTMYDELFSVHGGTSVKIIGQTSAPDRMEFRIVEGNRLSAKVMRSGGNVCLLSQQTAELMDKHIGSYIRIHGISFLVKGIYEPIRKDCSILVPYLDMQKMYPQYTLQHWLRGSTQDIAKAKNVLAESVSGFSVVEESRRDALTRQRLFFLLEMIGARMAAGVLSSAVGVVNLLLLIWSQTETRLAEYGIRLIHGAGHREIRRQIICSCQIPMLIASALLVISFRPAGLLLNLESEEYFDFYVLAGVILFAGLILLLISDLTARHIERKSLLQLLSGGDGHVR